MAIDYGKRRIGLAVSDETQTIATGLDTIDQNRNTDPVAAIKACADRYKVSRIVVGYPTRHNQEPSGMHAEIEQFIASLRRRTKLEIESVDESYSTQTAHSLLLQRGIKSKRHKGHVDRLAACQILQSYLDKQRT